MDGSVAEIVALTMMRETRDVDLYWVSLGSAVVATKFWRHLERLAHCGSLWFQTSQKSKYGVPFCWGNRWRFLKLWVTAAEFRRRNIIVQRLSLMWERFFFVTKRPFFWDSRLDCGIKTRITYINAHDYVHVDFHFHVLFREHKTNVRGHT
jgi:hypothetical protein